MQIDVLSLFPDAFTSFVDQPPLRLAVRDGLVQFRVHNLGSWVDAGSSVVISCPTNRGVARMISMAPVVTCLQSVRLTGRRSRTLVLSPRGLRFTHAMAEDMSTLDQLVLVCGRFGGFEAGLAQRIEADEVSIGEYVLTGGELAAMVITDCVTRELPGVLASPAAF